MSPTSVAGKKIPIFLGMLCPQLTSAQRAVVELILVIQRSSLVVILSFGLGEDHIVLSTVQKRAKKAQIPYSDPAQMGCCHLAGQAHSLVAQAGGSAGVLWQRAAQAAQRCT